MKVSNYPSNKFSCKKLYIWLNNPERVNYSRLSSTAFLMKAICYDVVLYFQQMFFAKCKIIWPCLKIKVLLCVISLKFFPKHYFIIFHCYKQAQKCFLEIECYKEYLKSKNPTWNWNWTRGEGVNRTYFQNTQFWYYNCSRAKE